PLYTRDCSTRDPHSFPTRRSSDLLKAQQELIARRDKLLEARRKLQADRDKIDLEIKDIQAKGGDASEHIKRRAELDSQLETSTSDRKSTRLNSSHVKISYAVFCLK